MGWPAKRLYNCPWNSMESCDWVGTRKKSCSSYNSATRFSKSTKGSLTCNKLHSTNTTRIIVHGHAFSHHNHLIDMQLVLAMIWMTHCPRGFKQQSFTLAPIERAAQSISNRNVLMSINEVRYRLINIYDAFVLYVLLGLSLTCSFFTVTVCLTWIMNQWIVVCIMN